MMGLDVEFFTHQLDIGEGERLKEEVIFIGVLVYAVLFPRDKKKKERKETNTVDYS